MQELNKYLSADPYRGRGIIVGMLEDTAIIAYFIMGRSTNSRNRIFLQKGEDVEIRPFDDSLITDLSLIVYNPILKKENTYIVTNGNQTDTIAEFYDKGDKNFFENALFTRTFEPDEPIYTPRISGVVDLKGQNYKLSIIKRSSGGKAVRFFYNYELEKNSGHIIHTYCGGNPPQSFKGEPIEIALKSKSIEEFSKEIWSNLDEQSKISLVVKYINLNTFFTQTKIINKLI
jgi:IMP cyclohydrolase